MKNNKGNYVDQEIKKMVKDQRTEKEPKKENDDKTTMSKLPYLIGIFMVISILVSLLLRLISIF
ncbi:MULTISPECIES: hypothetical protein [Aerococcus]|uniref:Uncharacterized protein n=2 Tax=Aerococcus TaxID=1375 RepID=A0A178HHI6_9LACT|nr:MULTISPECIES: hypothetical protein [Aerococcus]KAA9218564.1 hypothetical protein F6I39_06825 [Aerococcus loyolae]KAA9264741.1 hypothetical protein F6I19_06635 [Aerococcus loyolae]MCY3026103.1 hypothetical protein [Aerococcus loyolae]MCY3028040.1 hypothetical protein [Aerococcus loyolae]MCY3029362.1 hypothetical protein [Aerococcus loyolae]